ncbi:MAG: hypothetical protein RR183_08355 [Bacteroidales bacterium]
MENLFRLSRYRLRSKTGKIRHPYNPTIRESIALYSTLDDAITAMKDMVITEKNLFIYSFCIEEFEFKSWCPRTATERCYTKDGQLYEQYLKHEDCGGFRGHNPKDIRFKEGDIVEVLHPDGVYLEIVTSTPLTKEQVSERLERIRLNPEYKKFGLRLSRLDKDDDCYCTISLGEGDTHSHPHSMEVFPVSKPISAKHRKALLAKFKEYCSKDGEESEELL